MPDRGRRKAIIAGVLSLIPGAIVGLATKSTLFEEHYDRALIVVAAAIVVTIVLMLVSALLWYRTLGPLAVEVFLLDSQDRLLLYRHPYHQRRLPPGGKVDFLEPLHAAIVRTLRDRVGLAPGTYELQSLNAPAQPARHFADVNVLPCPFRVQEENHKQRRFKKHHVDFLFFGRLKTDEPVFEPDGDYKPVGLLTRKEMKDLCVRRELPPDVLDAYDAMIKALAAGKRPS